MKNQIRAIFNEQTITVYQAYPTGIAHAAIKEQTFVSPFKMDRMTWIKPSFLWMMYRSGWAEKEGQEHILAIKIKREGFEWAIKNSCLSHCDSSVYSTHEAWKEKLKASPVRIQWDPEKDIYLQNLPYKSIQIGLTGIAVEKYVNEWIVEIEDITDYCKSIHQLIKQGNIDVAKGALPQETLYDTPYEQLSETIIN